MPKSHWLLLWSGIQKILPESQACHQYFQLSAEGFDVGVALRVTFSVSLFADKSSGQTFLFELTTYLAVYANDPLSYY